MVTCLEYEGFTVEYVELSTDKLYGLTQHRVRLVVTVRLQEGGHYVHKPSMNDINVLKKVFTNACYIHVLIHALKMHYCTYIIYRIMQYHFMYSNIIL